MRTIIAGSRTIWDYNAIEIAINNSGFEITEVVCGMAPGADSVGWAWAYINGLKIIEMPADWNDIGRGIVRTNRYRKQYNPLAGHERNVRMAKASEALIAVHDGKSTGTAHMIQQAHDHGLKVYVHLFNQKQKQQPTLI